MNNVSKGKQIYDKFGVYIILVALVVLFSVAGSGFFSLSNLTSLLRTGAVYILFGCGMTFVMISGKIDLSIGSIAALVGCAASICMQAGMTPIPASLVGIAIGLACGFVNGFCIAKLKVPFFIMTAGMMYAASGLALVITRETSIRIADNENAAVQFTFWGSKTIGIIPSQFIVAIIFFVICFYLIRNTKLGRYTYAIGSNEQTARLSGVNVDRYNILIFTLNGLAAAIAGLVLASRLRTGSPNIADGGYNILAIAAAAIGGTSLSGGEGKIAKTVVGAFVICVISTGLNIMGVTSSVQNIVIGAVLVAVVAIDMFGKRKAGK
ncbi:MAG: ABC transporter permease [Clostridiales bacterium]|nr:ABC transporter permease [Clostridiales bacterium]MCD8134365.1 ABC transporter permease [Clostridiales bacterium]